VLDVSQPTANQSGENIGKRRTQTFECFLAAENSYSVVRFYSAGLDARYTKCLSRSVYRARSKIKLNRALIDLPAEEPQKM
jgi:hypothetical protein